jgi:hypothetical protein
VQFNSIQFSIRVHAGPLGPMSHYVRMTGIVVSWPRVGMREVGRKAHVSNEDATRGWWEFLSLCRVSKLITRRDETI